MKKPRILHELSLCPERVFYLEQEDGRHTIFANKKGEIIEEVTDLDGKKRKAPIKLSIHDEHEWEEIINPIDWVEAIKRFAEEGRGYKVETKEGCHYCLPGSDDLFISKEEILNGVFYPYYPDGEEVGRLIEKELSNPKMEDYFGEHHPYSSSISEGFSVTESYPSLSFGTGMSSESYPAEGSLKQPIPIYDI